MRQGWVTIRALCSQEPCCPREAGTVSPLHCSLCSLVPSISLLGQIVLFNHMYLFKMNFRLKYCPCCQCDCWFLPKCKESWFLWFCGLKGARPHLLPAPYPPEALAFSGEYCQLWNGISFLHLCLNSFDLTYSPSSPPFSLKGTFSQTTELSLMSGVHDSSGFFP